MSCFSPIKGYWSKKKHPSTGRPYIVFSPTKGYADKPLQIPCGRCLGCRLAHSFQWAVRCTCESYFHKENYFLTLTYDSEHLPEDGSLNRVHFQLFMKRLRKHFSGYIIKVFYCGEYGDRRHRPHYHAILFGLPLAEKDYRLYKVDISRKGNVNYENPVLTRLWGLGRVTIGTFTSASASYVAQYTLKKQRSVFNCNSKETSSLRSFSTKQKPFIGCSLRAPIGYRFFERYYKDIYLRGGFRFSSSRNTGFFGSSATFKNSSSNSSMFIRPLRFFDRQLEKKDYFLYWKYVLRPKRLAHFKLSLQYGKARNDAYDVKEVLDLDKKLFNRYIKEQRTLRRMEERLDL